MKVVNLYLEKMNRLILVFLLVVFAFITCQAQQYNVVTTKGNILYGNDKKLLGRGDKVDIDGHLVFKDQEAMAVLIGNTGERFILKKNQTAASGDSELMATIKDVLIPMKKMAALTTRGSIDHKIIDLEAMIGDQNFVIVGDKMILKLDEAYYPMDDKRYFIFSYYIGTKAVNKKIYFEENQLVFQASKLFLNDEDQIDPATIKEVKVFYRDDIKKDTRLISSFRPVVLSNERLKAECDILIDFYKEAGMDNSLIKEEINDYLNSFYGKTAKEPVYIWLENNYNL
jgi:hypothetical protein